MVYEYLQDHNLKAMIFNNSPKHLNINFTVEQKIDKSSVDNRYKQENDHSIMTIMTVIIRSLTFSKNRLAYNLLSLCVSESEREKVC